jgi:hypothetical protein
MKKDCSTITEDMLVYHVCQFVWNFLTPTERVLLRSSSLPFDAYAIWRNQALRKETKSLPLERPAPIGTPFSIDRVRKNGCTLLRFDFIYGNLVRWLEGEYTNFNIDYDTMFDNLDNLRTTQILPRLPQSRP